GFHQGVVTPLPGPAVELLPPLSRFPLVNLSLLAGAGIIIGAILLRQTQLPTAKARRFYRQLKQHPAQTLILSENRFARVQGSPDFLLYLANEARQQSDNLIANLADGLYLLTNRPVAGLSIIINTLDMLIEVGVDWQGLARWQQTEKLLLALLESPTITELGLLHPQLAALVDSLDKLDYWSPAVNGLLPIATSVRDSGRVELAQDRLIYLNEAQALLDQLAEQLPEFGISIETTLVTTVLDRWQGLVSAEIEELRGRAELAVLLKTRRLAPTPETEVVIEIRNDGRAPAENIIAALEQSPAYGRQSQPQVIRLLPPGHTRQVSFNITPKVNDQFRVALEISYNDRNRQDKHTAFADMVHLLPPQREFKPIPNPYLPGTPLRKNSPLFYGREELFQFIAENAGHLAQRNVLILIGRRRTGKTSVLLRLEQHLPDNLLPVYIDCQSLGVAAGMPALLSDLAWYIADALAAHNLEIDVPDTAVWQTDPTGTFQRKFLPQARQLLPPDTILLLVFDEFETFENLVDDGILPPTLFPYLRHLMQHSKALSFVFVGSRRLEEMSADYWSVLFNIALYQRIGYLSAKAATRLIAEPVRPNLTYDDLAIDKILRVTSGHPYFLQLVCYTLVKRANNQRSAYATISDVNGALDEMLSLGEVHFAYLWQRSQQTERAILMAMAHLMDRDAPFHPAELTQYLEPYGIHLTPAEVTAALDRLVERGIIRELPEAAATLYELGIGLVGLWVARYKSLSHLYAGGNGQAARKRR
ncbi:MAG: AAA family ATPase, partial [Anaerolineae bacterium]